MTESDFRKLNRKLKRRQAKLRRQRERNEPVHISEILPDIIKDIAQRMDRQIVKNEL